MNFFSRFILVLCPLLITPLSYAFPSGTFGLSDKDIILSDETWLNERFSQYRYLLVYYVPKYITYAQAIERIEWAYACSHLGDVNRTGARDVKHDLIFQSYPDKLDPQPRYPIFVDAGSGEYIIAPVHRDTDCNAGQYKMIGYHQVEIPNTCAVRRYQALHEGLITELEYEDLKTKHKAPQSLDNLRPVTCDELIVLSGT